MERKCVCFHVYNWGGGNPYNILGDLCDDDLGFDNIDEFVSYGNRISSGVDQRQTKKNDHAKQNKYIHFV